MVLRLSRKASLGVCIFVYSCNLSSRSYHGRVHCGTGVRWDRIRGRVNNIPQVHHDDELITLVNKVPLGRAYGIECIQNFSLISTSTSTFTSN